MRMRILADMHLTTTCRVYLEIEGLEDVPVDVTAEVAPPTPTRWGRYPEDGEDGDAGEVTILSAVRADTGEDVVLSRDEEERAEEALMEAAADDREGRDA